VLLEALKVSAVGVTINEDNSAYRLVVRLVATADNEDAASEAVDAIDALVSPIRAHAALARDGEDREPARMLQAMFDGAILSRDSRTISGRIEIPFALLTTLSTRAWCPVEQAPPSPSPPAPRQ